SLERFLGRGSIPPISTEPARAWPRALHDSAGRRAEQATGRESAGRAPCALLDGGVYLVPDTRVRRSDGGRPKALQSSGARRAGAALRAADAPLRDGVPHARAR